MVKRPKIVGLKLQILETGTTGVADGITYTWNVRFVSPLTVSYPTELYAGFDG